MLRRIAVALLLVMTCLSSLPAPGRAFFSQEDYDRGWKAGYAACPPLAMPQGGFQIQNDFYYGWVAGCAAATREKPAPPGGTGNGSASNQVGAPRTLPPLIGQNTLSGALLWRGATQGADEMFYKNEAIMMMDLASLQPLTTFPADFTTKRYMFTMMGQDIDVTVTTYTSRTGQQKVLSGGLSVSVSPTGEWAFLRVKQPDGGYGLVVVDLRASDDCLVTRCTTAPVNLHPNQTYTAIELPRVSWAPDSSSLFWTNAQLLWEWGGFISPVIGVATEPQGVRKLFGRLCETYLGDWVPGQVDKCLFSDLDISPDGQQLLITEPEANLTIYPYPFPTLVTQDRNQLIWSNDIDSKHSRLETAGWSPDGKWVVFVRRFCTVAGKDPEGREDTCGWLYGEPPGYIGVVEVATHKEYRLTDLMPIPYHAIADLVWVDTPAVPQTQKQTSILLKLNDPIALVNGQQERLDVPPQMIRNRVMIPLRFLGTALGAEMTWDAGTRSVTYKLGGREVTLWVDQNEALVDGQREPLDVPPTMVGARVLVPLRFLATNLGANITFNSTDMSIKVESK